MPPVALRSIATRYLVAWCYLAGVAAGQIVVTVLPGQQVSALSLWASTNVTNLEQHPVAALILSAFLPAGTSLAWLAVIPPALFGAARALGNVRVAIVCVAAHVIGTLVSEAVQAYRVDAGDLGVTARDIIDIGPSYIVVAAIAVAVLFGPSLVRLAALADLVVLIFAGHIFAGLGQLQVAPVGHATSIAVAVLAGSTLAWLRRQSRSRPADEQRPGRSHAPGASEPPAASELPQTRQRRETSQAPGASQPPTS